MMNFRFDVAIAHLNFDPLAVLLKVALLKYKTPDFCSISKPLILADAGSHLGDAKVSRWGHAGDAKVPRGGQGRSQLHLNVSPMKHLSVTKEKIQVLGDAKVSRWGHAGAVKVTRW